MRAQTCNQVVAKDVVYQHVTDPTTIKPRTGEVVDGITVIRTGSEVGRFLFKHSPMAFVASGVRNATIKNCTFIGRASHACT